ncbi:hypothetical protein AYO44_02920 [Planctomycetaceae bacterium SCGC AG-212-F19]|nr:hypothetical protein AYO44_02920 [Planctomycetaceae bacterium SCGC AG-212-F19]
MRITYKSFDSKMASREKLFKSAIDFANKLNRQDLINITHSEDRDNIVLTVWYWTEEPDKGAEIKAKREQDVARLTPSADGSTARPGSTDEITRTRPRVETHHMPLTREHLQPPPDAGEKGR